jgi:hypothetical protein
VEPEVGIDQHEEAGDRIPECHRDGGPAVAGDSLEEFGAEGIRGAGPVHQREGDARMERIMTGKDNRR